MQNTGLKEADNAAQLQFSFNSLPSVNNWIFVECGAFSNTGNANSITVVDNQANSYTRLQRQETVGTRVVASIHYGKATTSSGTFTFTVTLASGTGYFSCAAIEWNNSGVDMAFDKTSGNSGNTAETSGDTGTTAATTSANELVLAVLSISTNDVNLNITTPASSGYTSLAVEQNSQAHEGLEASYKTVAATGTQTASWTFDSADGWAAVIGTFTIQVSTGPPTGTLNLLGVGK